MTRFSALAAAIMVAVLVMVASAAAAKPRSNDPFAAFGVPDAITYETHGAYVYKCEVWTATGTVKKARLIVGYIERCYLAGPAKAKTVKPKAKVKRGAPTA